MTSSHSTQKNKIALIGASGRLGSEIKLLSSQFPTLQITHLFDSKNKATSCPVDLLLDVSTPSALTHNLQLALDQKLPLVIGTTGHASLDPIHLAAKKIPIFYAANFSLGMALLKRFSSLAAKMLPLSHIHLTETHHTQKKDAPSGSLKTLAAAISQETNVPIQIESHRIGAVIGKHAVTFHTPGEEITLTHEAHSRSLFAMGALNAALFLLGKSAGLYGMDDLLQ